MKSRGYWYLVFCPRYATICSEMATLSALTPAQCLELDAACHEVAATTGFGRVSIIVENGKPRWIEVSTTRSVGTAGHRSPAAVNEHPPPRPQTMG